MLAEMTLAGEMAQIEDGRLAAIGDRQEVSTGRIGCVQFYWVTKSSTPLDCNTAHSPMRTRNTRISGVAARAALYGTKTTQYCTTVHLVI